MWTKKRSGGNETRSAAEFRPRGLLADGKEDFPATVIRADGSTQPLLLHVKGLTQDEKEILLDGCLMNYYAARG